MPDVCVHYLFVASSCYVPQRAGAYSNYRYLK